MKLHKSLSLLSWLLWFPLKFSIISFLLILTTFALVGYFAPTASDAAMASWLTLAVIISAVVTLYNMPRQNMDQKGFVALNNAQMFILATCFMITMLLITAYRNEIFIKTMWLSTHYSSSFIFIVIITALLFLYLFGIFVTNWYAKFRRCREMGISTWKIICSMPFGFSFIWIPGYLINDEKLQNPAVNVHNKLYTKINTWIVTHNIRTIIAFITLTLYSGFFFGFNSVLLTIASAIVFMLWFKSVGLSSFRQQQNKIYSYIAITINVAVFLGIVIYFTQHTAPDITVNITDVADTQIMS